MTTLRESAQAVEACVWLHVPTGVRYRKIFSIGNTHELEPIFGKCRQATDEQMNNPEQWRKV